MPSLKKDSKITIVGAGVFGLSTALHLARLGYKDVTVFDYQQYHKSAYDTAKGCDGASSDSNKIFRASYGDEWQYQNLAFEGRRTWEEWNAQIAQSPNEINDTPVFYRTGVLRLSDLAPESENYSKLSEYDWETMEHLKAAGLRDNCFVSSSTEDQRRLQRVLQTPAEAGRNFKAKLDFFVDALGDEGAAQERYIDISGGFMRADKACAFVLRLCQETGVNFVLDDVKGRLSSLLVDESGDGKMVKGILTEDGVTHPSDLVIVACGGWTPSVLPFDQDLLETTAGTVVTIQLPPKETSPEIAALWERYDERNCPVWAYGLTGHVSPEFAGIYGFPHVEGKIKIGYRGRKWTHYQPHPVTQQPVSTPITHATRERRIDNLPKVGLANVKKFIAKFMPELTPLGITGTRLCWYTDSETNHFLVDYVPGFDRSLFLCTGGSGHGFKFLPLLGREVVAQLEGRDTDANKLWHWRGGAPSSKAAVGGDAFDQEKPTSPHAHRNGLEEGPSGPRSLARLEMATKADLKFSEADFALVSKKAREGRSRL